MHFLLEPITEGSIYLCGPPWALCAVLVFAELSTASPIFLQALYLPIAEEDAEALPLKFHQTGK